MQETVSYKQKQDVYRLGIAQKSYTGKTLSHVVRAHGTLQQKLLSTYVKAKALKALKIIILNGHEKTI
jgi:hypothetical protein